MSGRNCCVVLSCAVIVAIGCRAPSPEWNGTWKLDASRSSYRGPVLTISIAPDGEYRFDESSRQSLRCDGKEQPVGNNRTRVCIKHGTTLYMTLRENGIKTTETRDDLSSDGRVLTITVTRFRPEGPASTSQILFLRLSGPSNDFVGQWRDTSFLRRQASIVLRLTTQTLHIEYPGTGQYVDASLDGFDAAVHGNTPPGTTYAVRPHGRREFLFLSKRNGSPYSQGSLALSWDGSAITISWWNPDRPNVIATLVYEKQ